MSGYQVQAVFNLMFDKLCNKTSVENKELFDHSGASFFLPAALESHRSPCFATIVPPFFFLLDHLLLVMFSFCLRTPSA